MERTVERLFEPHALEAAGLRRVPPHNRYLDKYPVGEAMMILPFFLVGDAAARLLDEAADGFSTPYQVAAAAAGLIFALVGLAQLGLVLLRWFLRPTVVMTLVTITFGTAPFHYATYDAHFSHAFSFFLVAMIIRLGLSAYERPRPRSAIALGLAFGLLVAVRPTNAVLVVFLSLLGVSSLRDVVERPKALLRHASLLAAGLSAFVVPLLPQSALPAHDHREALRVHVRRRAPRSAPPTRDGCALQCSQRPLLLGAAAASRRDRPAPCAAIRRRNTRPGSRLPGCERVGDRQLVNMVVRRLPGPARIRRCTTGLRSRDRRPDRDRARPCGTKGARRGPRPSDPSRRALDGRLLDGNPSRPTARHGTRTSDRSVSGVATRRSAHGHHVPADRSHLGWSTDAVRCTCRVSPLSADGGDAAQPLTDGRPGPTVIGSPTGVPSDKGLPLGRSRGEGPGVARPQTRRVGGRPEIADGYTHLVGVSDACQITAGSERSSQVLSRARACAREEAVGVREQGGGDHVPPPR